MPQKLSEIVKDLNLMYPVAEISEKTGYSRGNVSEFLRNKREPSKAFLKKLYEVFNISHNEKESKEETITIEKELPDILGGHEARISILESFMEVAVPTMAELKAVNNVKGLKATKEDIIEEIFTIRGQILESSKKHLLRLQGKLFSFLLFFSLFLS